MRHAAHPQPLHPPHTLSSFRSVSGIGRAIALKYAKRGARLFVVGLRQEEVDKVCAECAALQRSSNADNVIGTAGNFTNVEDILAIRERLKTGACSSCYIYTRPHVLTLPYQPGAASTPS